MKFELNWSRIMKASSAKNFCDEAMLRRKIMFSSVLIMMYGLRWF